MKRLIHCLDPYAGWIFVAGVAAVALWHRRARQQDQERVQRLQHTPVPILPDPGPKVSVLLPAWRERDYIASAIEAFLALSYSNKEIIVCAGGGDGTLDIARRPYKKLSGISSLPMTYIYFAFCVSYSTRL